MSTVSPDVIPWNGRVITLPTLLESSNSVDIEQGTLVVIENKTNQTIKFAIRAQSSPGDRVGIDSSDVLVELSPGDDYVFPVNEFISEFVTDQTNDVVVDRITTISFTYTSGETVQIVTETVSTKTDIWDLGSDIEDFNVDVDVGYEITGNGDDTAYARLRVTPLDSAGLSTGTTKTTTDSASGDNTVSSVLGVNFVAPANTEQLKLEIEGEIDGGGSADPGTEVNMATHSSPSLENLNVVVDLDNDPKIFALAAERYV